jgi:ribose-phosphate pyrophosphokinase
VFFGVMTPHGLAQDAAEAFQYPGGEWDLRNTPVVSGTYVAQVKGADPNDLVKAALFAQLAHQRQEPFVLLLPYLPAARSDRPMDGRPVGVDAYGSIANSMNPQQIITIDPHSLVAERHYHKLTTLDPTPLIERAWTWGPLHHYDGVIAPDEGAVPRALAVAQVLGLDFYTAKKHRDTDTGKITGIKMTETLPHTGRYLVVDDICDGGGTFKGLSDATELPGDRLGLWVTHGIFSGSAAGLRQYYQHIYTTNSHPGHNRLGVATTVIPVESYLWDSIKESFA